jgi:hypothetical protein
MECRPDWTLKIAVNAAKFKLTITIILTKS